MSAMGGLEEHFCETGHSHFAATAKSIVLDNRLHIRF
jgi:hypothetical protein